MTESMSPDEQRRALKALGVPAQRIDQALNGSSGASISLVGDWTPSMSTTPEASGVVSLPFGIMRPYPIRLVLPWSALCSDNRKYTPAARRGADGRMHPVQLLKPEYREAKAKAKKIAKGVMLDLDPLSIPLRLVARVWVPDKRLGHDTSNMSKCAHDAFEGVIYSNDGLLYDTRWMRMGADVDHPRAEIEIMPL